LANCECNIAAEFPIIGEQGVISATLKIATDFSFTETACGTQLLLEGATKGDLSLTAYSELHVLDDLKCPGSASVSFNWDSRIACEFDEFTEEAVFRTYMLPRGSAQASMEGDVTRYITMTKEGPIHTTFNASAASGPHTIYLLNEHQNGYDFHYNSGPISVSPDDGKNSKSIPFLDNVLPDNSRLYLTNFSWSYTPPNIPNVSYSFLFVYDT